MATQRNRHWLVKIIPTRVSPFYIPNMYDPLTFADLQAPLARDATVRSASKCASASLAALDAFGLITNNMACKPVDLRTLRSERFRREAIDNPVGWIGFAQERGKLPLRCQEVSIRPQAENFLDPLPLAQPEPSFDPLSPAEEQRSPQGAVSILLPQPETPYVALGQSTDPSGATQRIPMRGRIMEIPVMDPQTCWNDIVALLAKARQHRVGTFIYREIQQEILEKLLDLSKWVGKGGFLPELQPHQGGE